MTDPASGKASGGDSEPAKPADASRRSQSAEEITLVRRAKDGEMSAYDELVQR
jgi:hypothetical protein